MKKAIKIGIGVGVVSITGVSIFAILRKRRLVKQTFDAAENGGEEANEMIVSENDDTDDEMIDVDADSEEDQEADDTDDDELPDDDDDDFDSDEADALAEEGAEILPDEEQEDDDTDDEMIDVDAEEEQEADDTDVNDEVVDIYPPIEECPYKSHSVWSSQIYDCLRPIFKSIMERRLIINWEEIENELINRYKASAPTVSKYDEKFIHHKFMKTAIENYDYGINTIDCVIDSIFANISNDSEYIINGHIDSAMIKADVALRCSIDGIIIWLPSYTKYLNENINSRCEYIEAVLAKNSINS